MKIDYDALEGKYNNICKLIGSINEKMNSISSTVSGLGSSSSWKGESFDEFMSAVSRMNSAMNMACDNAYTLAGRIPQTILLYKNAERIVSEEVERIFND